ncbi:DUF4253 domain-containing protein [Undibacterium danionis]|uniref:DUF4253 domain-containing protein n=1 Tax=Undibacterium danionis TaxID=1812100 RepID=A0ABV6IFS1_9BURK
MNIDLFTTSKTTGAAAIETLMKLRGAYPQTGDYPFLIGDAADVERLQEAAEYNEQSVDEILDEATQLDVAAWIQERRAEAEEYEFSDDEVIGEWPDDLVEKGAISLHRDILSGELKPEVFLGAVKIAQPWHLPATLKYGGWNDCPDPIVHCAMHQYWQKEFGAEIVSVSGDVIECIVTNPPRTKEAAIKLAWQQYWYCTDIVDQGCETISNLAASLLNAEVWYFWWD